eukprot:g7180.t1
MWVDLQRAHLEALAWCWAIHRTRGHAATVLQPLCLGMGVDLPGPARLPSASSLGSILLQHTRASFWCLMRRLRLLGWSAVLLQEEYLPDLQEALAQLGQ